MFRNYAPWLVGTLLVSATSSAVADGLGERITTTGTSTGTVACKGCHGPQGKGNAVAGFPALAGMDVGYLTTQLRLMRDGRRISPVMAASLGSITDEEIAAVARYYAALPKFPPAAVVDGASAAIGRQLAKDGDWPGRNLPACVSCHGPQGRGVGAVFPVIAGQHASYLSAQLRAWKAGERRTDPNDLMGTVARKLTADEIVAVSAWFAAQSQGAGQ
jgi:cytochrome c553